MRTAVRFLPLVVAVAIGAGVGHLVVSEWVMPRPPEFAAWKARRGGSVAGGEGEEAVVTKVVVARGEKRIGGAEKVSSDGLPWKHRWTNDGRNSRIIRPAEAAGRGTMRKMDCRRGFCRVMFTFRAFR